MASRWPSLSHDAAASSQLPKRLLERPSDEQRSFWQGGAQGFFVQKAANADWGIDTVVGCKALGPQRVRPFEQNVVGLGDGLRCRRRGTGDIPAWTVPTLGVRTGAGIGRTCKSAGQRQKGGVEAHPFHQRGRTRTGKCNVPTTRIDRHGSGVCADLTRNFGVAALA